MSEQFENIEPEDEHKVSPRVQFAEEWNIEGTKCLREGQHDLAEIFYRRALAANPDHPSAAGNLVLSFVYQGRAKEAVAFARDSFDQYENNKHFLFTYAYALYWAEEDYFLGLSLCQQLEGDEEYEEGFDFELCYGAFLFCADQIEEAEERFQRALLDEGEAGEPEAVYMWLIQCCLERTNFADREAYFKGKLLMTAENDDWLSLRTMYMAVFYHGWYDHLQGFDPALAKCKIDLAQKYVEEAEWGALLGGSQAVLEEIAEISDDIKKDFERSENGFDGPEEWVPS